MTDVHTSKSPVTHPLLGVTEWFRTGEEERVEQVLAELKTLGVTELRTAFSWSDDVTEAGEAWYAWLMPRLARDVNVLPCFTYTPRSLGVEPRSAAPPRDPQAYTDWLDSVITRFGDHFEWVELWNAPNHVNNWDYRLDPEWRCFSEMVGRAAQHARSRGKKVVLAGTYPTDPAWLDLMARRGVLRQVDAVGVHGFPGTWEYGWEDWHHPVGKVRAVLDGHGLAPEIWITAGGYSTWEHDEFQQVRAFLRFAQAPVARAYWYAAHDLDGDLSHKGGVYLDERHYHLGLVRSDGRPKLLYRIWAEKGLDGVRALAELGGPETAGEHVGADVNTFSGDGASSTPILPLLSASKTRQARQNPEDGYMLITGGAGFVGTNVAHRLLSSGEKVRIFDNLSRPGVEQNLRWLLDMHGDRVQVQLDDARNPHALRKAVWGARQVYHFAAQVAVTTSVKDPLEDFEVNLKGVFNVLEAVRALDDPPPLLYTSTNKVYGRLDDVALREVGTRYEPVDRHIRRHGIGRTRPLDFHSPYGCSKGGADQYVLDYARIYGLPTVVFRMSCIYGPHQFGTEDQGWVAHFLLRALDREPITLFGDGKQVRDILYVDDLVDAMLLAHEHIDMVKGQAFNIGGGPGHAVSLLELVDLIGEIHGEAPKVRFDAWRPGDQRYYVSDISHFREATGWKPRVPVEKGVRWLYAWLQEARMLASRLVA